MSIPSTTRQWILTNAPKADVSLDGPSPTFTLKENPLPKPTESQVVVKPLYLSNDPAQRGWIQADISPERLYVPPVAVNTPMHAFGICEVLTPNSAAGLEKGTLVSTQCDWTEYAVIEAAKAQVVHPDEAYGIKPTHFLGALGLTGLTAYHGLEVVRTSASDTVVVSGAAGATGSMVVQIAKNLIGCKRVIGIAGSEEKCRWVESLGADVCVNYKSSSFKEDLIKATDGYVEVYFDNVGGDILDLMLTRIKRYGRIAACGAISNYNSGGEKEISNWNEIIFNRIEIRGLIVLDSFQKWGEHIQIMTKGAKDGKIKLGEEVETVVKTKFEDVPKTWMKLFSGGNQGKLVTALV